MNIHHFAPTILRAYDIRGIYQDTLSEDDAHAIGMAFVACLRSRGHGVTVAVGRDGRLSSPALAAALIDGLVKAGGKVLDIGCGPTPMLYFAGVTLKCDGAIQVTGSHNPPTHNGFKMVMNGSRQEDTTSCEFEPNDLDDDRRRFGNENAANHSQQYFLANEH